MIFFAAPPQCLTLDVGDRWTATFEKIQLEDDGTVFKTDRDRLTFAVESAGPLGYKITVARKFEVTSIDNTFVAAPGEQVALKWTFEQLRGDFLRLFPLAPAPTDTRVARFFELEYPIFPPAQGLTWRRYLAREKSFPSTAFECEIDKLYPQETWTLSASDPAGMSATGAIKLLPNGLPESWEWTVRKALLPGAGEPSDFRLVYRLVEFFPAGQKTR